MHVSNLSLNNFRKFAHDSFEFRPNINFLLGPNASGKTSVLEALYLVSRGKSPRTNNLKYLAGIESKNFRISANFIDAYHDQLNFKYINGSSNVSSNTRTIRSRSDLANEICIRLVNNKSFQIFQSGPKFIRSFIDWQILNTQKQYLQQFKSFQQCSDQLRQLTRIRSDKRQIKAWLDKYVSSISIISNKRSEYLHTLDTAIKCHSTDIEIFKGISIHYEKGFSNSFLQDPYPFYIQHKSKHLRYFPGPQHARINFMKSGHDIGKFLSRGQIKIFMISLQIIVNLELEKTTQRKGIIMIDDLPSEFDNLHICKVFDILQMFPYQYFVTSTDPGLHRLSSISKEMFHVEHLV